MLLPKKTSIILLLFVGYLLNSYAEIEINGTVLDNDLPRRGLHIKLYNVNGVKETISDMDGRFYITAEPGDVIEIDHHDYHKARMLCFDEVNYTVIADLGKNKFQMFLNSGTQANQEIDLDGLVFSEEGYIPGFTFFDQDKNQLTLSDYDGLFHCKINPNNFIQYKNEDDWMKYYPKKISGYQKVIFFKHEQKATALENAQTDTKISPLLLSLLPDHSYTAIHNVRLNTDAILIPGGYFEPKKKNRQRFNLDDYTFMTDMCIMKNEVSNKQYCDFLNQIEVQGDGYYKGVHLIKISKKPGYLHYDKQSGKFSYDRNMENLPVQNVSWIGAQLFAKWAGGRLPSLAEWQYAVTLSEGTDGDSAQIHEWFKNNSGDALHPVGTSTPYLTGLQDLTGNLAEWSMDGEGQKNSASFLDELQVNPCHTLATEKRAVYGVSYDAKIPDNILDAITYRPFFETKPNIGFRVAFDVTDY